MTFGTYVFGDENHHFLAGLLAQRISPGHRNRYRNEEVEPLSGANMANLFGVYSVSPDPDPLKVAEYKEMCQLVAQALDNLTDEQGEVIMLRFGLFGLSEHTLQGTAEKIGNGCTKEKVQQIEFMALRTLRHPSIARKLIRFLM